MNARTGDGLVIAGDGDIVGNVQTVTGSDSCGQTTAQRTERIAAFEMDDVGQKDHKGMAVGIDPKRCSGEAGVAIGTNGE